MNSSVNRPVQVLLLALGLAAFPSSAARAQTAPGGVKVEAGYSLTVFARSVTGKYTKPDSIAVSLGHVYIGYGDGNDPAGLDGKANQIVEYSSDGRVLHIYNVAGHNDGLKVDPATHKIWAMQNEDGNPNLVIIDPATQEETLYTFAAAPSHGGGYDDIVFRNGEVYFSASNPANNPNSGPAIVKAKFQGSTIQVSPLINGDAQATNIVTGQPVTLNLQDPDSMTVDPQGNIVLDSQGDSELVIVRKIGSIQNVLQLPLSSPLGTPQVDDTIFTPSNDGVILVSDTPADTVYAIHKTKFAPGIAYSGGVGAADAQGNSVGFVGKLDLDLGQLTPIVTGLQSPHGIAFLKVHQTENDNPYDELEDPGPSKSHP